MCGRLVSDSSWPGENERRHNGSSLILYLLHVSSAWIWIILSCSPQGAFLFHVHMDLSVQQKRRSENILQSGCDCWRLITIITIPLQWVQQLLWFIYPFILFGYHRSESVSDMQTFVWLLGINSVLFTHRNVVEMVTCSSKIIFLMYVLY